MRKIIYSFTLVTLLFLVSCAKEQSNKESLKTHQQETATPGSMFSEIVRQNIKNADFKSFVLENASSRFDGDFNFLVAPTFSLKTKSNNDSFGITPELIDLIAREEPLLQVYVLHPEAWSADCLPLIIYLPEDFDDQETEFINAYTPDGDIVSVRVADTFDSLPVIVVSHNERTVAVTPQQATKALGDSVEPICTTQYFAYFLREDICEATARPETAKISIPTTKATSLEENTVAKLLGPPYSTCSRISMFPSKDYITRVRPSSKSAWSDLEPAIMGDPELYFFLEYGNSLGGSLEVTKEKKYIGTGYKNRNNIQWKDIDLEMLRWSLVENGAKIKYEWWEDDGGAMITHTSSIQIDLPDVVEKLIKPQSIDITVSVGKKDDYAGSTYVYYIDENNHIYNTSYVMFEIEQKRQ